MTVGSVGTRAEDSAPGLLRRPPRTTPLAARPDLLRRRPAALTALALGLAVVAYAVLIWQRRWISDDGLIFLRTVRQILDGNGPVFNAGERVEANTSTLWTVLLLALAALPVRLEYLAVGAGLVLSVLALALALDAARRFTGHGRVVVPAGALVVLAVPPFWEFGTSGLETGLSWTWLAGTWWLLVHRSQREPRFFAGAAARRRPGRAWPTAFVIGLGPLVRPDLAVVAVAAAVALAVLEQPRNRRGRLRLVGLAAVCVAVPVGYEIFRAGYYGLLLPATALAKEASVPRWGRGYVYLRDTVGAYWLWLPALILVVAALGLVRPRLARMRPPQTEAAGTTDPNGTGSTAARRTRAWDRAGSVAVALVPLLGGIGMVVYVVRVGGDFMHARMLLPSIFCLLLPVMALPVRRATVVPLMVLLAWALMAGTSLRPSYTGIGAYGIADERGFYRELLATPHPLTSDDYRVHPYVLGGVERVLDAPGPVLALQARGRGPAGPEWQTIPLAPGQPSGIVWLNLGVAGALAPLDVRVSDTVGLANPLAAHLTLVPDGRVGHDKSLPPAWLVAAGGGTAPDERAVYPEDVAAAARALRCPALRELDASVHAPLTPARFWANLSGARERTALRFPRDPVVAEVACR